MHFLWSVAIGMGLGALGVTLLVHMAHLRGMGHPRPRFQIIQKAQHHLGIALFCALVAGFVGGALTLGTYTLLRGPHGYVEPPEVAQIVPRGAQHSGPQRSLGLFPPAHHVRAPQLFGVGTQQYADLSALMPPVPFQGTAPSCASWAVAYALRGYYAALVHRYPPGGYAPYYIYAQLAGRTSGGTRLEDNLRLLAQQGVDTQADYPQQRQGNYTDPPTPHERAHAAQWRSQGYQILFAGAGQGVVVEEAIRQSLVNGDPVVVGLPIYDNLLHASRDSYYVTGAQGTFYGLHAVVIAKTDASGAWIFGSWGTDYGLGGWIEVSYGFLDRYATEAAIMIMPRGGALLPSVPCLHCVPTGDKVGGTA